jgi:ABC-type multidrug transport system fused ATPase/permease subunit
MIDYCDIPSEPEPKRDDTDHVIQDLYGGVWPCRGEIYFNEISMKYRPELPYALKGVDLHIYPGTKVACVGRTGAGKSSMVQALLRMVEIEHELGRNITIDGIDISDVAVEKLRRSIAIIPQTTMMFTGTIRRNLDPFGEFKEDDLWEVLEEVELKNYISGLKKKLDTDVSQSNAVFSVG